MAVTLSSFTQLYWSNINCDIAKNCRLKILYAQDFKLQWHPGQMSAWAAWADDTKFGYRLQSASSSLNLNLWKRTHCYLSLWATRDPKPMLLLNAILVVHCHLSSSDSNSHLQVVQLLSQCRLWLWGWGNSPYPGCLDLTRRSPPACKLWQVQPKAQWPTILTHIFVAESRAVAGGDLPLTWSHHDGLAASAPAEPACRLHIDDHDDMMIQIAIFAFNSPLIHQKNDF